MRRVAVPSRGDIFIQQPPLGHKNERSCPSRMAALSQLKKYSYLSSILLGLFLLCLGECLAANAVKFRRRFFKAQTTKKAFFDLLAQKSGEKFGSLRISAYFCGRIIKKDKKMSRESLEHLRDYIQLSLSPSDITWLTSELLLQRHKQEQHTPYTVEELYERVAESEQQIADGQYKTAEESLNELEALFADEPTYAETA